MYILILRATLPRVHFSESIRCFLKSVMKSMRAVDNVLSTTFCGIQPFRFVFRIQVKRHLVLFSSVNSSAAQQLTPFSPLEDRNSNLWSVSLSPPPLPLHFSLSVSLSQSLCLSVSVSLRLCVTLSLSRFPLFFPQFSHLIMCLRSGIVVTGIDVPLLT